MSDYTPPTLVTPTPGGSAGDGSISGALTIEALNALTSYTPWLKVGKNGAVFADVDVAGNTNFYPISGGLYVRGQGSEAGNYFGIKQNQLYTSGYMYMYNGIFTKGYGVPAIFGLDGRTGLTAADASALTLYTTTAAGQVYRLMGRILATAGTSPSATYTIKWTEGGATITKTLTISALDSDSDLSVLIQPDNGTAITAQLTAISGTGTTVNVAATVEQMA